MRSPILKMNSKISLILIGLLVTVAQARLEMILNKVASVNEVNKFIDFWTRAFRSMSQILGLASGEAVLWKSMFYVFLQE